MQDPKVKGNAPDKAPQKAQKRVRAWAFVAYPDSAPSNWEEIIDSNHIPWCRSPLHDRDINPGGEPKKPHWHIVCNFDGVKTYDQVLAIAQSINATIPQPVDSIKGYVRYLAHLDNPEKAQYNRADIKVYGGMDIEDYLANTKTVDLAIQKEMLQYVIDNDITEYEDLVIYAMYNNDSWFESLANRSTYFVNAFIKSRRSRREKEAARNDG